jgi:hypothetical protein
MPASFEPCPEFRSKSVVLQALTEGAGVVGSDVEVVSHTEIQPRINKRHILVQRGSGHHEWRAAGPPQCRNSARQTPVFEQIRDCTSAEEDQLSSAGKCEWEKRKMVGPEGLAKLKKINSLAKGGTKHLPEGIQWFTKAIVPPLCRAALPQIAAQAGLWRHA